tara:strand:- start:1125 stop:1553 length:429 start_codon:yes stop_codon:yes gene_type:complete
MNETETKKGKIVAYQPDGTAEIRGSMYNRYKVTFADGNQFKFLNLLKLPKHNGEFKKKIGEEVEYKIINEQYKNASFITPPPQTTNNYSSNTQNRTISTNDSIMFQVCYKANMEVFGSDYRDSVHKYTEEDFKWMSNFLNNL